MGICIYWSCRHVIFVKRCNYSFYLTVGNLSQLKISLKKKKKNIEKKKNFSDFWGLKKKIFWFKNKNQAHFLHFGRKMLIWVTFLTKSVIRRAPRTAFNFQVQAICRENFMRPNSARGFCSRARSASQRDINPKG